MKTQIFWLAVVGCVMAIITVFGVISNSMQSIQDLIRECNLEVKFRERIEFCGSCNMTVLDNSMLRTYSGILKKYIIK